MDIPTEISETISYHITSWLSLNDIYKLVTIPIFKEHILKFIKNNLYWHSIIVNNSGKSSTFSPTTNWVKFYPIMLPEQWYDYLCTAKSIECTKLAIINKYTKVLIHENIVKLVRNAKRLELLRECGVEINKLIEITCDIAESEIIKECIDLLNKENGKSTKLIDHAIEKAELKVIDEYGKYYEPTYVGLSCGDLIHYPTTGSFPFNKLTYERTVEFRKMVALVKFNKYIVKDYGMWIIMRILETQRWGLHIIKHILQSDLKFTFGTDLLMYILENNYDQEIAIETIIVLMQDNRWIPGEKKDTEFVNELTSKIKSSNEREKIEYSINNNPKLLRILGPAINSSQSLIEI